MMDKAGAQESDTAIDELAELEALYSGAPLGLGLLDRELKFRRVNAALAEMNGAPAADHIGKLAWEVVPGLRNLAEPAFLHVLQTGEAIHNVEISGFTPAQPDRLRHWIEQFYPIKNAHGSVVGVGVIIEETTHRKELEAAVRDFHQTLELRVEQRTAELQSANDRLGAEMLKRETVQRALAQSQKMEAVGQLTSGIAHDFNNVLAAVSGAFAMTERRIQDPKIKEIAQHGAKAAQRGTKLVKQLLAFARKQPLVPESVDLCEFLREFQPLLQSALPSTITLNINCSPEIGRIRVDTVQLETALINLAVNARDAMPQAGSLQISALSFGPRQFEWPTGMEPQEAVAIIVTDTGPGMSPEVLSRAAEPFFTTKPPGVGTGLGLSMADGFARQSGGELIVENGETKGARVTLVFPVDRNALPDEPAHRLDESRPMKLLMGTERVLLVDDDDDVRAVTASELSEYGYSVTQASSALTALEILSKDRSIDILVSDVVMLGGDGAALAHAARGMRSHMPIVFITGHADRTLMKGETVLDKPFTIDELAGTLRQKLDG